jgi:hypothetical protein
MRLLIAGALMAAALPALSSPFGDRYPAGSIKDPAQAEQALRDANAEAERIERESRSREAECLKGFLVNRCRESARRDRIEAERELRRVRVEAHDLQRRVQAQEGERKRAEAAAEAGKVPDPAAPPEPRAARTPDAPTREGPAKPGITAEEAARNREAHDKRVAEKQAEAAAEAARAPERAENARAYQDKQAEAAERARQKEAERKKNEERRAERRKQIEAQEAQRAEVRRKAEEAKAAAKP